MTPYRRFHQNQSGQNALETAIILIAFVVVASVFAFTVLSAGQASTERGEAAIYRGLAGIESSMSVKGAVIATTDATATTEGTKVETIVFTVSLVSGGDPVDLTPGVGTNPVVIGFRDSNEMVPEVEWAAAFVGANDDDTMLEDQELAQITVTVPTDLTTPLGSNMAFTLEVKPPTGAVIQINRTTPASLEPVVELR